MCLRDFGAPVFGASGFAAVGQPVPPTQLLPVSDIANRQLQKQAKPAGVASSQPSFAADRWVLGKGSAVYYLFLDLLYYGCYLGDSRAPFWGLEQSERQQETYCPFTVPSGLPLRRGLTDSNRDEPQASDRRASRGLWALSRIISLQLLERL